MGVTRTCGRRPLVRDCRSRARTRGGDVMTVADVTHPGIALVDTLAGLGVPFVVLHREDEIAAGIVRSDVDIAVIDDSFAVTAALVASARAAGLRCICVWPYDVATTTTFWLDSSGRGVQLDIAGDS